MDNRTKFGLLGALAAVAILFGIVQSSNLGQTQTHLAAAQKTATAQASALAEQATGAANIVTAGADEQRAVATSAAQSQADAVTEVAQAAASEQAQALASAEAQATGTLSVIVAQASTAQSQAVTSAQQVAGVQQEQALASAAVEATTTLGAAVDAAATQQAGAVASAEAAGAMAVYEAEVKVTETLMAAIAEKINTQNRLERTQNALVSAQAESNATQAAVIAVLTEVSGQLATVQANPTATPQPTLVVLKPQSPTELCAAAAPVSDPETRTFRQAEQVLKPNVDYFAVLCTGAGAVYVDLNEKLTPVTVNNFVFLAQAGFYNNTTFDRVLPNFLAQAGDPTGTGGPGYTFGNEIVPSLRFDEPGRLAMANAGPNTNGSQFFITLGPQTFLDGDYSIFGQVVEGQAHVRQIELRDPTSNPRDLGTTLDTVLIITDPGLVRLSSNPPPTRDEVVKALDAADNLITADQVGVLENTKLNQTSDEVVDAAPVAVRGDLGAFFDAYHHRYRVASSINNLTCDTSQSQFYAIGYALDAFATEADAAAAIADPVLEQMALKSGFDAQLTSARLSHPYFTVTETRCDQQVIHAMTFWRHGTFIVTVNIVLPVDGGDATNVLDTALLDFVGGRIYEPLLTDILYSAIE